ncbi:MAG TPA: hypothetical protein DFI01_08990, partial [Bacteroidales bacterium]|nr:hypothetical protein [Bacteroidales bacterium]
MHLYSYLSIALFSLAVSGVSQTSNIVTGDMRPSQYMKFLKGKNVAVVANQASVAGYRNVVDELMSHGVKIKLI